MNKLSLGLLIGQSYVGCSTCGKLIHEKEARKGYDRFYCKNPDAECKAEIAKRKKWLEKQIAQAKV